MPMYRIWFCPADGSHLQPPGAALQPAPVLTHGFYVSQRSEAQLLPLQPVASDILGQAEEFTLDQAMQIRSWLRERRFLAVILAVIE